jgi:hypothetical protein
VVSSASKGASPPLAGVRGRDKDAVEPRREGAGEVYLLEGVVSAVR